MNPGSPEKTPMQKGAEHYENIGNSINNFTDKAKKKLGGWLSGAKSGLGRLWKGAATVTLASPHALADGYEAVADASLNQLGKVVDGINDGIDTGFTYAEEKAKAFDKAFGEFSDDAFKKAGEIEDWVAQKAENMKDMVRVGAFVADLVGTCVKERTQEALRAAGKGISDRYEGLLKFGKESIEVARHKKQQITDKWNLLKNSMRIGFARVAAEEAAAGYDAAAEVKRTAYENLQAKNAFLEELLAKQNGQEAPRAMAA